MSEGSNNPQVVTPGELCHCVPLSQAIKEKERVRLAGRVRYYRWWRKRAMAEAVAGVRVPASQRSPSASIKCLPDGRDWTGEN